MDFEQKLEKLIAEHGATKRSIARLTGIAYSTFQRKCKKLERWNIIEFGKLVEALRLTPEEQAFLCHESE